MVTFYIICAALLSLYVYWNLPSRFRSYFILALNIGLLAWFGWLTVILYIVLTAVTLFSASTVSRLNPVADRSKRRKIMVLTWCALISPIIFFRLKDVSSVEKPLAISYTSLMLLGYFMDVFRGTVQPIKYDLAVIK